MMRILGWIRFVGLPLATLLFTGLWALPGQAQPWDRDEPESVRRPFRGLFGGTPLRTGTTREALDLTASAYTAYDDVVSVDSTSVGVDSRFQESGPYSGLTVGLAYVRRSRAFTLALDGSTDVSYSSAFADSVMAGGVGGALSAQLGRRAGLRGAHNFTYRPFYGPEEFAGLPAAGDRSLIFVPPGFDSSVLRRDLYSNSTVVDLWREVGRRSRLTMGYGRTDDSSDGDDFDVREQRIGVNFERRIQRDLSLRLGYVYRTARFGLGGGVSYRNHDVDAGVDYRRALSLSRRTRLSFGTGSTLIVGRPDVGSAQGAVTESRFFFLGNASLVHEIGRTWTASLSYRRGVEFAEGFGAPFIEDGVTGRVSGYANRRLNLDASGSYSVGSVGLGTGTGFDNHTASGGMTFAILRTLAVYGRYVYYHYRFKNSAVVPAGLPSELDRHGVRVGLRTRLSLWRKRGVV